MFEYSPAEIWYSESTPERPEVLIVEDLNVDVPPEFSDSLQLRFAPGVWQDADAFRAALAGCQGLVVRNKAMVTRELLANAPRLKVIGRLGVGLDNIDLDAARDYGVAVVYPPDANTDAVAEYCLAQSINALRRIPAAQADASAGGWNRNQFIGRQLAETTFGIIGYGHTGRGFANLLVAHGATVLVTTRYPEGVPPAMEILGLSDLLARADVISLHVASTPATHHLLNRDSFSLVKPNAILINTSRGDVVDEVALLDTLNSGRISLAILDVRHSEPPDKPDPFERHPKAWLTPHIAAFTSLAQTQVVCTVLSDVLVVIKGEAPSARAVQTNAFEDLRQGA